MIRENKGEGRGEGKLDQIFGGECVDFASVKEVDPKRIRYKKSFQW